MPENFGAPKGFTPAMNTPQFALNGAQPRMVGIPISKEMGGQGGLPVVQNNPYVQQQQFNQGQVSPMANPHGAQPISLAGQPNRAMPAGPAQPPQYQLGADDELRRFEIKGVGQGGQQYAVVVETVFKRGTQITGVTEV